MGSHRGHAEAMHPVLRLPSPMSLQVAVRTPFGPIFHRFGLHFGSLRRPFFLMLSPFWLQSSSEIAMTRLQEDDRKYTETPKLQVKRQLKFHLKRILE